MRSIRWSVVDLTLMIKLLPISVAKVLPRIELLPELFLVLAPTCLSIYLHVTHPGLLVCVTVKHLALLWVDITISDLSKAKSVSQSDLCVVLHANHAQLLES